MTTQARRPLWQTILRRRSRTPETAPTTAPTGPSTVDAAPIDIPPDDPAVAYFQSASGVVDVDHVDIDSPAIQAMKEAGIQLVVPLVSQGELVGLLNLGPRLSQQEYSTDDRTLLSNLATQATPAVRVAQLVRQQQSEAQERERIEHELQVARLIQHTLLPKTVPELSGYQVAAFYQPAREVGGDFYDFIDLNDGRLGLVVGDVTDKGVPAALVMATTRSVMRAAAAQLMTPGKVLERVNDLLVPDIPANMFVTCLYAILDPATGRIHYANAGHDLPYLRRGSEVTELRATGMPLGLMTGMQYEEKEATLDPGDTVLLYSDGLVEAHDPEREMFGLPRLQGEIASYAPRDGGSLVDYLLSGLTRFTGEGWEQEDDITLMTIRCLAHEPRAPSSTASDQADLKNSANPRDEWETLVEFEVPSQPGNERLAMQRIEETLEGLGFAKRTLDRLGTAVGEVTMNAMEHGNQYQADIPVGIRVLRAGEILAIRITDHGTGPELLEPETPDLDAKLAGLQTPRGWGLFLIKNMVDEVHVTNDDVGHTVELIVHQKGNDDGGEAV